MGASPAASQAAVQGALEPGRPHHLQYIGDGTAMSRRHGVLHRGPRSQPLLERSGVRVYDLHLPEDLRDAPPRLYRPCCGESQRCGVSIANSSCLEFVAGMSARACAEAYAINDTRLEACCRIDGRCGFAIPGEAATHCALPDMLGLGYEGLAARPIVDCDPNAIDMDGGAP